MREGRPSPLGSALRTSDTSLRPGVAPNLFLKRLFCQGSAFSLRPLYGISEAAVRHTLVDLAVDQLQSAERNSDEPEQGCRSSGAA